MVIIMKIELLKYSNHYRRRMAALKVLPESCKEFRESLQRKRDRHDGITGDIGQADMATFESMANMSWPDRVANESARHQFGRNK